MPAVTPTWQIPYALGSDALCEAYLTVESIAERVDTILDAFDVDLARTEVIPLARVSRDADMVTETGGVTTTLTFENADFDTANLVNLSLDPSTILINSGQYYLTGAYGNWVNAGGVAGNDYELNISLATGSTIVSLDQRHNGGGAGMNITAQGLLAQSVFSGDDYAFLSLTANGTVTTVTTQFAYMWVMWMGDI